MSRPTTWGPAACGRGGAWVRHELGIAHEVVHGEGLHLAFFQHDADCTERFKVVLDEDACHQVAAAAHHYLAGPPPRAWSAKCVRCNLARRLVRRVRKHTPRPGKPWRAVWHLNRSKMPRLTFEEGIGRLAVEEIAQLERLLLALGDQGHLTVWELQERLYRWPGPGDRERHAVEHAAFLEDLRWGQACCYPG